MGALAAEAHVSSTRYALERALNKRIFNKRVKQLRHQVAEGVRLCATRPRGGAREAEWAEFGLGLLHIDIGIYFALLHQWKPGPLAGTWISETSLPEVEEVSSTELEATGTLSYNKPADDRVVARARYRVSASRDAKGWAVRILTVQDGAVPAAS